MKGYWCYTMPGETFDRRMHAETGIFPIGADRVWFEKYESFPVLPEDLPQPKKAKAQYQEMNHWKNRRKR